MSLSYLYNNQFQYQDIPANAIIYRSGTSGFETIQQEQGILMSDGTHYSFGVPTAAELIKNYTGNSIVMTCNNKLVEVPVEGTSPNKLLRQIDGQWKVVDFSVQYIKPELYDPSSWQLWIADNDINVINIPKDSIENNWYGVKYNTELDQFDVTSPVTFPNLLQETHLEYMTSSSFAVVSDKAILNKIDTAVDSSTIQLDQCSLLYTSARSSIIFNIDVAINVSTYNGFTFTYSSYDTITIQGGLFIENYNEYSSNAAFVSIVTDGVSTYRYRDAAAFKNVNYCVKFNSENSTNLILPLQLVTTNWRIVKTFTKPANINIYTCIYTDPNDTAIYHWYYPRNFLNMYVTRHI